MARNYEALTAFLAERSDPVVELTFTELDRLVGGLPASARKHPAWWANSRTAHSHTRYWLDAKRRASPDFNAGRVRFTIGAESTPNPHSGAGRDRSGASLTRTGETVEASVQFEWLDVGGVTLDAAGKLVFPGLPDRPGIYRFTLVNRDGDLVGLYLGESDNLARRMGSYRNPGPTQPTNQRLNARIKEVLASSGRATTSVAINATIGGQELELADRPARLVAENAVLIRAAQQGLPVENL